MTDDPVKRDDEIGGPAPASADGSAAAATGEADVAAAPAGTAGEAGPATGAPPRRVFYALGILVQVLFWFLIFFALAVAIGVGGQLTEFRYVGF